MLSWKEFSDTMIGLSLAREYHTFNLLLSFDPCKKADIWPCEASKAQNVLQYDGIQQLHSTHELTSTPTPFAVCELVLACS